jgi:DNA recombination protein RmuC
MLELILMLLVGLLVGLIVGYMLARKGLHAQRQADEQRLLAEREETDRRHRVDMEQQLQLIKSEMNNVSERILKERAQQLSAANEQHLGSLLNPLRENIRQMKEAVEKSDREQTVTMERLDASIKENLRQAQEVGERADRLAQALTSENKTQGNFGELRLKQLLQEMGLEEGLQFEEQTTMRDEQGRAIRDSDEGHRLVPDVILHFPDDRDVIIDSKMSFTAFQDYFHAQTDEERQSALRRHVASVRQHVYELSRKNYSSYIGEGRHRLDFVMMYVFSESALQLALSSDPTLWREAYDRGVIIAGSQSLFIMLRVLEMTWRQVRQVENQQEIMKTASMVVERVQLFYERFLKADDQLRRTSEAFDEVKRSTQSSGLSITTAAQRLLKFGAQENPKRKKLSNGLQDTTVRSEGT